jgi:hypothetical protein
MNEFKNTFIPLLKVIRPEKYKIYNIMSVRTKKYSKRLHHLVRFYSVGRAGIGTWRGATNVLNKQSRTVDKG